MYLPNSIKLFELVAEIMCPFVNRSTYLNSGNNRNFRLQKFDYLNKAYKIRDLARGTFIIDDENIKGIILRNNINRQGTICTVKR